MASDIIFRKAAFGGFKPEDVMTFVSSQKEAEILLKETIALKESEVNLLNGQIKSLSVEIERLKQENEDLLRQCESSKSAEEQIGSAMIDVRRFSDQLVDETKDRIIKMSGDAASAASNTLSRVNDISLGIKAFAEKLNSILGDVLLENESISNELSGFIEKIAQPYDEIAEQVESIKSSQE